MSSSLTQPIVFEPLYMERVWGGRRLEEVFGKKLPPGRRIGESWEIVDRPQAQSVVRQGPLRGRTLHELWMEDRAEIFGAGVPDTPRFPILAKLLDASDKLSLQVHPPPEIAESLGGEAKSELWYFAASDEGGEIFAGLRAGVEKAQFEAALRDGGVADLVHRIAVNAGDVFFVPSGRLHGIGEGNLIVEIQQNSDTTYRVFDWERMGEKGEKRELHLTESMQAMQFDDYEPKCSQPEGEELLHCDYFTVEKWEVERERAALERPEFAIFACLSGVLACAGVEFCAGDFFLIPALAAEAEITACASASNLLRITLPDR